MKRDENIDIEAETSIIMRNVWERARQNVRLLWGRGESTLGVYITQNIYGELKRSYRENRERMRRRLKYIDIQKWANETNIMRWVRSEMR